LDEKTTARRSCPLPAVRLSVDDLQRLAEVFTELSEEERSSSNPVFRFETTGGTFISDTLSIESARVAPQEVKAIEMRASGRGQAARLYLDLEESAVPALPGSSTPDAGVSSFLEVEGNEAGVGQVWNDLLALVGKRTWKAPAPLKGPLPVLAWLVLTGAAVALPILTQLPIGKMQTFLFALVVSMVLGLVVGAYLLPSRVLALFWPRVTVAGWGRLEGRRGMQRWWTAFIALTLVVWSVGLALIAFKGR